MRPLPGRRRGRLLCGRGKFLRDCARSGPNVAPSGQFITRIGTSRTSPLLFAYGLAGIVGNFAAAVAASRKVGWTLLSIALVLALMLPLFPVVGGPGAGGALLLLVWGIGYGGVSVSLQTWIMRVAPRSIEAATSMFVAVFNLGIASGAFLGGVGVDAYGLQANMVIAGGFVAMALALTALIQADIARSEG